MAKTQAERWEESNARWPVRSFRTDPDVAAELERLAAEAGMTQAAYVRRLVEQAVRKARSAA
jgi:predicted DNA-binding protein